jgi:ketosteroid isomerase-like protein
MTTVVGCRSELHGVGTTVSRRQDDGTWRIVLDDPLTGT